MVQETLQRVSVWRSTHYEVEHGLRQESGDLLRESLSAMEAWDGALAIFTGLCKRTERK